MAIVNYIAKDGSGNAIMLNSFEDLDALSQQGFLFYKETSSGLTPVNKEDIDLSSSIETGTIITPQVSYVDDRATALLSVVELLVESAPTQDPDGIGVQTSNSFGSSATPTPLQSALANARQLIRGQ